MARRKRREAKPLIYAIEEIGKPVKGAKGHRVKVGRTMHVPPYESATLGVMVPRRVGEVTRVYRREGDERVLADLKRHHAIYTVEASRLHRSAACPDCFGTGKDGLGAACPQGCRRSGLEFEEPPV